MAKDIINKQLNISKDSELNKKSKKQIMASTIDNKEHDKKEVDGVDSEKEMHQINNECIKNKDIAIIGIACRFPGAENYGQFWENIKLGLSNIQEIPQNRWDWQALWGDPQIEINKSNSKWGGFIKNVDTFDASFFGFSPRESEVMDPQQRIMLELAWSCLEDGGIRPSDVSGKKVGVYLGVFSSDYKELQEREFRAIEMYHSIGTATAVVANRISHYFNFKGPSIPIDTACSSALSAIHAAINSLRSGECSMALVGGINLLLTPTRYISYSKTGMLSPTGSCKTFDESADGYVRGEGAGLILVKPLEQAIKDGDSIYGILKGSAINHNGKTHTLTYPNPEAQADVIIEACKQARVTPESISYIEAHGTGTPKGDPLEFQGLLKAFESLSSQGKQSLKRNYCGLGAVKTNIGHLECAAGIAGVIKVLLSMKYKQLPGLQNFKRLNHRIAVENSPFYFIDRLQAWKPLKDVNNKAYPRRAGVSSFGFGGTNAHVILEEAPVIAKHSNIKVPYYLICLSAKTKDALRRKEEDLLYWLEEEGTKHKLIEISATLLMGREHFAIRSAFVVRDVQELQKRLKQVLEKGEAEGYYIEGNIKKGKQMSPLLVELGKTIVKELQANKLKDEQEYGQKLMALAELYTSGHNLDWQMILPKGKISRISLPTYPFARERYWISDSDEESYSKIISSGKLTSIHPLLHQNTSDLFEQRFSSSFTGEESFLADYVVKGQRILPRVAYLEMARAAIGKAVGSLEENQIGLRFKNVVWARPIAIGKQSMQVHIGIYPEENGEIAYEIYSEPPKENTEPIIHSQGSAALCAVTEGLTLDVHSLRVQCDQGIFSSSQCYEVFRTVGLDYGPGYQGIEQVYVGQEQVLAKLTLPATVSDTKDQFILHPSLMDAALQASLMISASDVKLALPFALQELEIFEKCTSSMWALIRYSEGSKTKDKMEKIDIDLCDEQGRVCVRMKGLSSRVLEGKVDSVTDTEAIGTLMLQPSWQEQPVDSEATMPEYDRHL
ncbi:MAG: Mycocerosate synthase, 6-deoxyerythronolide-B synthase, partial [Firmicutes bacterium]|nr:Mycocerosate synthase, 6-deoxyerythronolide-B synthase [Bacillota bacterium]